MGTFLFTQKNSSAIVTISSPTFEEAKAELFELVKDSYGWRYEECDDED